MLYSIVNTESVKFRYRLNMISYFAGKQTLHENKNKVSKLITKFELVDNNF